MTAPARPMAPERVPVVAARRPLRARFSTGHIVMAVAGLVGALLTLQVLRSADDRISVMVLRRDVPAGVVISAEDLATARVRVDAEIEATLIGAGTRNATVGQVATRALRKGDLVSRHDVRTGTVGTGMRAMSIPIDQSRAAAGDLAAGDRVDVIATTEAGAEYIVIGAEVLRTGGGNSSGPLRGASADYFIKIAVNAKEATALAFGMKNGTLDVIAATGARPLEASDLRRASSEVASSNASTSDGSTGSER